MNKFDCNKKDLYHEIEQEVKDLEAEFDGLAPIDILIINLGNSYTQHEIANGISELIKNNIINKTNDNQYLRSCY